MALQPERVKPPKHITTAFSTRKGGVSSHPFQSLNMSISRGDDPASVAQNRTLFLAHLGVEENQVAIPQQVSLDGVQVANKPGVYAQCDSLMTDKSGVILSVLTADCAPLLIWSDVHPFVAAVHSGWQGSERDILGKTLHKARETYGLEGSTLHMVIGPGLTQRNFEVGPEFGSKFPSAWLKSIPGTDRFLFDNNGYLESVAIGFGIPQEQIEILPYCSYTDADLFFSHRRDKGKTGRMMSVIGITK